MHANTGNPKSVAHFLEGHSSWIVVHRNEAGSERGQSDEDLEEQDEDARREAGHHHNDSYAPAARCSLPNANPAHNTTYHSSYHRIFSAFATKS